MPDIYHFIFSELPTKSPLDWAVYIMAAILTADKVLILFRGDRVKPETFNALAERVTKNEIIQEKTQAEVRGHAEKMAGLLGQLKGRRRG